MGSDCYFGGGYRFTPDEIEINKFFRVSQYASLAELCSMPIRRECFAITHYDVGSILVTLGGYNSISELCSVQAAQYSLKSNIWTSLPVYP